jgi:hypothetical protein
VTPSEVRNEIFTRYLTEFSGQFSIALDNQPFVPPETGEGVKWVRISVIFNDGFQSSLGIVGNRKFEKQGNLFMQIFTPIGHATNDNDELVENSLNLFEGGRIGDLWFNNGRVVTVGPDGEWYQQNAVLDIIYQTVK